MAIYTTGAVLSPPDARDYQAARFAPAVAPTLPPAWDFTPALQPVRNQGSEGTCVGHTVAGAMGYQQNVYGFPGQAPDREVLSVRGIYWGARTLESFATDGATLRSALKYAQIVGAMPERFWPYVEQDKASRPLAGWEAAAHANRILTYARANQLPWNLRQDLYWHGPGMVVINVDEGFASTGREGIIRPAGRLLGAHAVVAAGWNHQGIIIRNSWGPGWGNLGNAILPFDSAIRLEEAWVCTPALDKPVSVPWFERMFPQLFMG